MATQKPRIFFVDNLRIFLTILVVLHHLSITYGGPGGWFYRESELGGFAEIILTLFVATNQAYFMGFFFFLAAYFTPASFNRKGWESFYKDRLLRLGLPMMAYYLLLGPLTVYFNVRYNQQIKITFWELLKGGESFTFGPMWFVEALLYFTLFYLGYRLWVQGTLKIKSKWPLPGNWVILGFALLLSLGTFIIRIWLPVGIAYEPLDFQFAHFLQYIVCFILGIVAYENNWLEALTFKRSLRWFYLALFFIFILFPLIFTLGMPASGDTAVFMGGLTWQSLVYSIWEQFLAVAMILGLLGLFRKYFNNQGKWGRLFSKSAYTVYIIHSLVLVGLCIALQDWDIYPLYKFLLLSPVMLMVCFLLAEPIRRLPFLDKIL